MTYLSNPKAVFFFLFELWWRLHEIYKNFKKVSGMQKFLINIIVIVGVFEWPDKNIPLSPL